MADFTFELDPPAGIFPDDTSFSTKGRWRDALNVRFTPRPEVIGPFSKVFDNSLIAVSNIFPFTRGSSVSVAYGTGTKLYVGVGRAAPSDRTPASLPVNITGWCLAAWGSTLLAAPHGLTLPGLAPFGGKLYEQTGTSTATEVTEAPDHINYMLVFKRMVMAFGTDEEASGQYNDHCIRWSDIEDYSSAGSWSSSAANNAGEFIIDGCGGLVAALPLGDYLAVWTTTGLYIGKFLGDPSQPWIFEPVAENCGLLGWEAACVHNGAAYWLDQTLSLYRWTPGFPPEIIPCSLSRFFADDIKSETNYRRLTRLVPFPKRNELWILYHSKTAIAAGSSGYKQIHVCLNDVSWSKSDINAWSMTASGLFHSADTTGELVSSIWGSDGTYVYAYEKEYAGTASGPASWYLESADQYIESGGRRVSLSKVRHDADATPVGEGSFNFQPTGNFALLDLTVYTRFNPESVARTYGPVGLANERTGAKISDPPIDGAAAVAVAIFGGGGVQKGRWLTIEGVNAWVDGADSGVPLRFTCAEDYDPARGGGGLHIDPPLVVSGASRNISALPINDAAVTLIGPGGQRNIRVSGMILSVKIGQSSGVEANGRLRLGKFVFTGVIMGGR